MLRWIDVVRPAGQHGHRAGCQRALVGRAIDAPGEAGDDGEPGGAQVPGQILRQPPPAGGGVPGADQGHAPLLPPERPADQGEHRRRVLDCGEGGRVVRLSQGNEPAAGGCQCIHLLLGGRARADGDGAGTTAAASQMGQGLQRGLGRAVASQQMGIAHRAHILGPDQPEPMEPLLVADGGGAGHGRKVGGQATGFTLQL